MKEQPLHKKREIQRLTSEQLKHLLDTAQEQPLKTLLTVAVTTGLRRGEALGLHWQDIEGENELLHVRRMVSGYRESTMDTARIIALPAIALQALQMLNEHHQALGNKHLMQGEMWPDQGLVFPNVFGEYHRPDQLRQQYHTVFVAAGFPHLLFHDLRHSTVALFVQMGVPLTVIQAILGVRHWRTSIQTLTPVTLSMQKEAMKHWDILLSQ